jgi:prefoldin subunit 5
MIPDRLRELQEEFQRGRDEMSRLDQRRSELHAVLLRISGAIQVLEELAAEERNSPAAARPAPLGAVK